MNSPKVVGSKAYEVTEREPPGKERYTRHKWLSAEDEALYDSREFLPVYIQKTAEEKMRNHALLDPRVEVMGLMLGRVHSWKGNEYVLVKDVVTSDLQATSVEVRFDRNGYEGLFDALDDIEYEYVVVGWYHSHPGHGCFLSDVDIGTQRAMFTEGYHTAVVIDPVNREMAAFHTVGDEVRPRPFAIYWDRFQNPYHGTSVVMRKLVRKKDE